MNGGSGGGSGGYHQSFYRESHYSGGGGGRVVDNSDTYGRSGSKSKFVVSDNAPVYVARR